VPAILQKVPLFSQLAPVELERVAEITRERSYPRNSVILFEDDPGDALYVVATGQVKVVLIGEDGREVILSVLGEGDFFGEMSLIDEEPRSAHVIAMEDSNLLVIRREDFQAILQQSPGIAMGLLRELSRRLRRVDEKVGSLVLLDVNGRVASPVPFWGRGGSTPTPGAHTARYGGNTPCVAVRSGDEGGGTGQLVILDAGTGIRPLGRELVERQNGAVQAEILLSHAHWDHIQGLPHFKPFFAPGNAVRIWGSRQGTTSLEAILRQQMDPAVFPVPLDA